MKVKDYMFTKVNTITPDKTVSEAVEQMVHGKTNSLIVIDEQNKPIGIVSSQTIINSIVPEHLKIDPLVSIFGSEGTLSKYTKEAKNKKISEIMYKEFHALSQEDAMIEAAAFAIVGERRILPVVNKEGVLVGAVTRTCIKNALHNMLHEDHPIDPTNGGCGCCQDRDCT